MRSAEVVAKKGFVGIPRSRWGGINRHAVIWRDISCREHFGYVFFGYVFLVTFFLVTFFWLRFFLLRFSGDICPYRPVDPGSSVGTS